MDDDGDDDDDDDDDDDEQSTDEENEEDDSDLIDDVKPKCEDMEMKIEEFTLPDTIEGVRDSLNEFYVGFMRNNKHEHRNEYKFNEAEKEEDSDDEEQKIIQHGRSKR